MTQAMRWGPPWFWPPGRTSSGSALSRAVWLLWPFAWMASLGYRAGSATRNALYGWGWLPMDQLSCPVISIGNIRIGGTGKTPFTIWLYQRLADRGYRVGIVTRGYGGTIREPRILNTTSGGFAPDVVGDEAALMARRTGGSIAVGRNRGQAGRLLLDGQALDVVLLEDGFQHLRLKRDLDIVLVDAQEGFTSRHLLPAGSLREPEGSLHRGGVLLMLKGGEAGRERFRARVQRRFGSLPVFEGSLRPTCLVMREGTEWREIPLSMMAGRKVLAVCGIARPEEFYRIICDSEGEIVEAMEFPDHHAYSLGDWKALMRAAIRADLIVTTEKDLVKLERFPFVRQNLCAVRVDVEVQGEKELVAEIKRRARL